MSIFNLSTMINRICYLNIRKSRCLRWNWIERKWSGMNSFGGGGLFIRNLIWFWGKKTLNNHITKLSKLVAFFYAEWVVQWSCPDKTGWRWRRAIVMIYRYDRLIEYQMTVDQNKERTRVDRRILNKWGKKLIGGCIDQQFSLEKYLS